MPIPSGQARCRASLLVDFVIPFCVYHEFERNPVKVGYRNVPSVIYPAGSAAGWIGHRVSSPSPRVVAGPHVKVCKLPASRSADSAWQNSSRMDASAIRHACRTPSASGDTRRTMRRHELLDCADLLGRDDGLTLPIFSSSPICTSSPLAPTHHPRPPTDSAYFTKDSCEPN